MILTGAEIVRQWEAGNIQISPYEPLHINAASIDLRLGDDVVTYDDANVRVIDIKRPTPVSHHKIKPDGFTLRPGCLYLMHTVERIHTTKFVPVLDGKSSIGRHGIQVHLTAGYGDPGFDGQYTLEVVTVHPIRIYAGMRFCQMRFHTVEGHQLHDYRNKGHYISDKAVGAVPSRAYEQFE